MIKQSATSIANYYDSNAGSALSVLNTGGLFFQDAPQDVTEPYTVFSYAGSDIDEMMGGKLDKIERANFVFNTFSAANDGGIEALDISEQLQLAYDEADLTIPDDYTNIRFQRTGTSSIFYIDDVWQITNLYTLWLEW
jgi:hypothetical protein